MKKIIKSLSCSLLSLAIFSIISCNSPVNNTTDNDKTKITDADIISNDSEAFTGKDEKSFKSRLKSFGLSVDDYSQNRPGVEAGWEPLEGVYEIPSMSGKNYDYKENLNRSASRSASFENDVSTSVIAKMKMPEVYVCGAGSSSGYDGIYSYENGSVSQYYTGSKKDYILKTTVKAKSLDLNDDGFEDVVVASFDQKNNTITLYARIYDPKKNKFLDDKVIQTISNEHIKDVRVDVNKDHQGFDGFDFGLGDVDGDNLKEFVVSICYDVNQHGRAVLYIIDDYKSEKTILNQFSEIELFDQIQSNKSAKIYKFACADLNGDGCDEIYTAIGANCDGRTGYYRVYGYNPSSKTYGSFANGPFDKNGKAEKYNYLCAAMVDVGDVDGDGEIEVVFEGRQKDYTNCICLVLGYDAYANAYTWEYASEANYDGKGTDGKETPYLPMAVGDIDQDGIEEIVFFDRAYKFDPETAETDYARIRTYSKGTRLPVKAGNSSICIGDFDYDGQNEVAQVNWAGDKLYFSKFDEISKGFKSSAAYNLTKVNTSSFVSICPIAAKKGLAQFKYKRHLLQFTEPDVVALVAAPLYFSEKYNGGVDPEEFQPSYGNQGTGIGKSSSKETSLDKTFTLDLHFAGGFCAKPGPDIKIGACVDATYEKDWGDSESKEIEISFCTHEKDMVVVKMTPVDVYIYEIINLPGDPSAVGNEYYIPVPRTSVIKACEVDYYEKHKAEDHPSVKDAFTHTPGNPFSCDNYDAALRKIEENSAVKCTNSELNHVDGKDCFITGKEKMISVPQGNTEATMSFSKNKESYVSRGFNINAGIEFEASGTGGYFEAGIYFGGGNTWTTTIGEGSSIEGTVVGIASEYIDDYSFNWAIVSYPVAVEKKYFTPLVTYIVEK